MISTLSNKIALKLTEHNMILQEDYKIYVYGFFMLISKAFFWTILLTFGILLKAFIEAVVFGLLFSGIRQYAGGYHASTETRCQLLSTLAIFFSILLIKISKEYDLSLFLIILTFISTVIIFFLCPLDTPEKPLSENEIKYFRKKSRVILMVIFVVAMFSFVTKVNTLLAPCSVSLLLETILIVCGKIKKSTI